MYDYLEKVLVSPVKDVSAMKNSFKIMICEYFFEKFCSSVWLRSG